MKPEYQKGADAHKNFEETMLKLLRVPKPEVAKPTPKPKKGESEK